MAAMPGTLIALMPPPDSVCRLAGLSDALTHYAHPPRVLNASGEHALGWAIYKGEEGPRVEFSLYQGNGNLYRPTARTMSLPVFPVFSLLGSQQTLFADGNKPSDTRLAHMFGILGMSQPGLREHSEALQEMNRFFYEEMKKWFSDDKACAALMNRLYTVVSTDVIALSEEPGRRPRLSGPRQG